MSIQVKRYLDYGLTSFKESLEIGLIKLKIEHGFTVSPHKSANAFVRV